MKQKQLIKLILFITCITVLTFTSASSFASFQVYANDILVGDLIGVEIDGYIIQNSKGYRFKVNPVNGNLINYQAVLFYLSSDCSGTGYYGNSRTPDTSYQLDNKYVFRGSGGAINNLMFTTSEAVTSILPLSSINNGGCNPYSHSTRIYGHPITVVTEAQTGVSLVYTLPIEIREDQ